MTEKITRRDALKLGTSAAVTATVSPLLVSTEAKCAASRQTSRGQI